MLYFQCPPKPAHMYTAFLSKIRNLPELQERNFLKTCRIQNSDTLRAGRVGAARAERWGGAG